MNRTEYMQAVYASNLDPTSKAILVYYGFCKNWKDGTFAFPSNAKTAKDTGFGIATVKRKIPELRSKGYLSDTGERKGRGVIVYDLADPTSITVIPQKYHGDTAEVSERYRRGITVIHRTSKEQEIEQEEEQVRQSPVADAPVDNELRGKGHIFLNSMEKKEIQRWCRAYRLNEEEMIEAVGLTTREGRGFEEALDLHLNKKGVNRDEW